MSNPLPVVDNFPAPSVPLTPIQPVPEKPKLSLVPPLQTAPELKDLLAMYKQQSRECWLCAKIAGDMEKGKTLSEDDTWHFTTCVLTWEKLPSLPQEAR